MAPPEGTSRPPQPQLSFAQILSRQGLVVFACAIALSAMAWLWLWQDGATVPGQSMSQMPGMKMPPLSGQAWSLSYLATSFVMWAVMMVAMMLPSATPMILLHDVFSRKNRLGGTATLAFAATYLALWTAFALVATLIQAGLIAAGLVDEASLAIGNARLAAALLLAVAAFELSPLKRICLAHCQSPLTFVTRHWRPGVGGAITMGWRHGLYCVGCCAGLMFLLLVGGVMNLAWIAILTLIVLAEKYAPPALRADRVLAGTLTLAAIAMIALSR